MPSVRTAVEAWMKEVSSVRELEVFLALCPFPALFPSPSRAYSSCKSCKWWSDVHDHLGGIGLYWIPLQLPEAKARPTRMDDVFDVNAVGSRCTDVFFGVCVE